MATRHAQRPLHPLAHHAALVEFDRPPTGLAEWRGALGLIAVQPLGGPVPGWMMTIEKAAAARDGAALPILVAGADQVPPALARLPHVSACARTTVATLGAFLRGLHPT